MNVKKEYYLKRVETIKKVIDELINMLMLPKKELMSYSLKDFQKLDKLFSGNYFRPIIFQKAFPKRDKK